MKEGDELTINGPYGEFYLHDSEKDMLLVATGSGLAPLLSILHQIEKEKIGRKTTLFFGARTVKDLLYYDEVKTFETRLPDFTFIPTLSRPTEEDQWQGEKGRVTDLIEKYITENADVEVYICGSLVMVESCEGILKKKGISEESIFYDKFE
jgi:Na+-transporting NADH:ubiquinone oxidoreductase subunit F